jgi:putative hemolysin
VSAMGDHGWQLALIAGLVLVNAVFSGSEMALVSLRDGQLQRLARDSAGGRVLARLARDPNRYLATIQIGITLAGFLASAVAAVSLAEPLVPRLGLLHGWAEPAAIVLVTAALTVFTLVVGERAPKRIARPHPEAWALATAWPLSVLAAICRPAGWLLGAATNLVVLVAGADPHRSRHDVTTGEIRDLVTAVQSFSARQRTIIHGAFEITERALRAVVVPRQQVLSLPADLPAAEGVRRLIAAGHSRAPVTTTGGLDNVLGIVHVRDIIHADGPVAGHSRPALLLPDTLTVCDALRHLRQQRQQMALVVDEQGGVEGIITLEDLVEEVVGEIDTDTDTDLQAVIHQSMARCCCPAPSPSTTCPTSACTCPTWKHAARTSPSPGCCWPASDTSPPNPVHMSPSAATPLASPQ